MPPSRDELTEGAKAVGALARIGLLKPSVATAAAKHTRRWGPTPPAGYAAAAGRVPFETAIVDDDGVLSFAEVHGLSNALARALVDRGVTSDDSVALLCRNHRWFVVAAVAIAKTGADTIYLNTGFAGPQIAEAIAREGASTVIADAEFVDMIDEHGSARECIVAWTDGSRTPHPTIADLVGRFARTEPDPPARPGRQIILTSGTTGTPKGAKRPTPTGLVATTAIFRVIPWRIGDVHLVAAPMFHALGNGGYQMAAQFSHRLVCQRRYDPEATLAVIDAESVTAMTCVPVMLQRILELPDEVIDRYDTSSLRLIQCGGAALPGSLAIRWMDRFGDHLYNMFASTEVGTVSIATPADMRVAPGSAGRPLPGTVVKLFDDDDREVPPGQPGRIFAGSGLEFEGYTGGVEHKAMIDGLMSIGDVGYFDPDGRLFVGGRDDDMIVSGGENVFPREVADLLADHPAIGEVAVIGVDDDAFGARLAAFVVVRDDQTIDEDAIKQHVRANLAGYKVPRSVTFLDELPRTSTGKIQTKDLREPRSSAGES